MSRPPPPRRAACLPGERSSEVIRDNTHSRFTPHFLTRVPLKMVRRAGLGGVESASSLGHSPAREARRGQLHPQTS